MKSFKPTLNFTKTKKNLELHPETKLYFGYLSEILWDRLNDSWVPGQQHLALNLRTLKNLNTIRYFPDFSNSTGY